MLDIVRRGFHTPHPRGVNLPHYGVMSGLAVSIGILAGFAAVFFRLFLAFVTNLFLETRVSLHHDPYAMTTSPLGWWVVLVPAIGGLISGLLTYRFAREAKGHGVPEVIEAMLVKEGRIRPRVGLVKALASAFTIGSGGSAGREGPIVQIGAATGSGLAQKLGLGDDDTKILLACGAAGGLAATFNTPIGGVLFALEIVLLEFRTRSFIPLVISTVMATIVSRAFFGDMVTLPVKGLYTFSTSLYQALYEIPLYLLLGVICGFAAIAFIKLLYGTEGGFEKLRIPEHVKPMIGGLLVGIMGFVLFEVLGHYYIFGVSYGTMMPVLRSEVSGSLLSLFLLLLLLFGLKMVATGLTIGSGGSGGIFSPMLFFGAMIGGAYGIAVNWMLPDIASPFGVYALIGMAALFAGASRATLTAIVILFEMTSSYELILPLMFGCVVSDAVCTVLSKETVYTLRLTMRGFHYSYEREVSPMETHAVKDVMARNVRTVTPETHVGVVADLILSTGYQGFPVLSEGRLVGIVTHSDIRKAVAAGLSDSQISNAVALKEPLVAHPDDLLEDALERMAEKGYGHLPVVDPANRARLVGFLTRDDIMRVYRHRAKEKEFRWRL
ncbi:MAG: chloride channel protein [Candidatus Thermoplasmatota archaeon]